MPSPMTVTELNRKQVFQSSEEKITMRVVCWCASFLKLESSIAWGVKRTAKRFLACSAPQWAWRGAHTQHNTQWLHTLTHNDYTHSHTSHTTVSTPAAQQSFNQLIVAQPLRSIHALFFTLSLFLGNVGAPFRPLSGSTSANVAGFFLTIQI